MSRPGLYVWIVFLALVSCGIEERLEQVADAVDRIEATLDQEYPR